MAISPQAVYPGQVDTTDPTGYPRGKAQDDLVEGDGFGTPLEQAWVNDLWGFLQALLAGAGATPTGVPDKVGASQYLDAIKTITYNAPWTDFAAAANYPYLQTDTNGGLVCLYNPIKKLFYSFNVSGGNTVGFAAGVPFIIRSALTIPAGSGLTPACGDVDPVRGNMVIAGAPGSSSQSRVRQSADGNTWNAVNSVKTASTAGPLSAIYCGGTFDKWFTGYSTGEIETSTGTSGGAVWTNVGSLPDSNSRSAMAFSSSLNRLVVLKFNSTAYLTSDDGVTFTARTAPANFQYIFWSAYQHKFYAAANGSPNFYSSPDGIIWTSLGVSANHPGGVAAAQFFEYGRVIGCLGQGQLALSLDGMATWKVVAYFSTMGGMAVRSDTGFQVMFGNSAGDHKVSLQVGL
jgi:hypothetical protein